MIPLLSREKSPSPPGVIPTRILVVDEEPLIRWALCAALTANGFEAVSASDAAEARRVAGEWPPPRVVLLDRRAGDDVGDDLLEAIRAQYAGCRFVILTTATDSSWRVVPGVAAIVVQKPFDIGQVVRLVRQLAADPAPA